MSTLYPSSVRESMNADIIENVTKDIIDITEQLMSALFVLYVFLCGFISDISLFSSPASFFFSST